MKKILKWFAPLLFVGVTVFLIFFLVAINQDDVDLGSTTYHEEKKTTKKKPEKLWLDHFSKAQRKGYLYPVNEIYVKVALKEKITKASTYKLSAKLKDPYQLFCLQEELKRYKLRYFLKKDKMGIDLFIYSRNVNKLKELVKVLKNYNILAQIKLYKEEK